ncbi:MAG: ComEC/Rec2 family competence protein [Acidobacteriaceae bacterium]
MAGNIKLVKYFLLPLFVLTLTVYIFLPNVQAGLLVEFFDVGQGDSTFIQTSQGNQILIDGGPKSVIKQLSSVMPFYDRDLDLVILTHPHQDHINGLIEVLKRYRVKQILLPEVVYDSSDYKEFLKLAEEKHVSSSYAFEGQRIYFDSSTVFDIYYPPKGELHADSKAEGINPKKINPNETSIVGKLSFGKTSFLFTGDIGTKVEELILPKYDLNADVLKVAHQGSKNSTSEDFVEEVTPEYSVISVGQNSYGHPTREIMDRLTQAGSQIFRTDNDGSVIFHSDGKTVERIK